jgi:glucose-1-phosphate cytidylyltransferase
MKVVILCGGQGTRLREETEYRPKPLVDIGGRPILWHIMKLFAHHGLRDFVLALGYRGNMIKEYFLNYQALNNDFTMCLGRNQQIAYHGAHAEDDFRVTLADTGLDTMTGGRVRRVRTYVDKDTFLLTYGDGVANVDLRELMAFHRKHGKLATVTTVAPVSRYGVLEVGPEGEVSSFSEKPRVEGWVNAGFFVLHRRVFEYLDGDQCIFEREPLQRLAEEGQLMAYRHDGFFYAMDTYREYKALNELWATGKAPWKVWHE